MADASKWEKVGKIAVDSGTCWVGDPCYVLHKNPPPPDIGADYKDFAKRMNEREAQEPYDVAQFARGEDPEFKFLGMTVSTGYGDGIYDVEVRRDADSGRIAELRVVFIPKKN